MRINTDVLTQFCRACFISFCEREDSWGISSSLCYISSPAVEPSAHTGGQQERTEPETKEVISHIPPADANTVALTKTCSQ